MAKTESDAKAQPKKPKFDLEAALAALPPESKETQPSMPVATASLEGWRLVKGAKKIRAKLLKLPNFEASWVDDLPAMLDALAEKEKAWKKAHRKQLSQSTKSAHDEAVELKGRMLAAGRYLEKHNPDALSELADIAAGDGVADLIQDLKDLAGFADDRQAGFEAIPTLPKDAIAQARKLALVLEDGVETDASADAKALRNQVYALVDKTVHEVRAGAELILHDEPRKLAPLLSRYSADRKAKSRRSKKSADAAPPTAAPPAAQDVKN